MEHNYIVRLNQEEDTVSKGDILSGLPLGDISSRYILLGDILSRIL